MVIFGGLAKWKETGVLPAIANAAVVDVGMWACGYVDMWICGHVDMWVCGHVDMWICGYVDMWVCE